MIKHRTAKVPHNEAQRRSMFGDHIEHVIVNGQPVGAVAKNKHGIWLGVVTTDLANENPFVAHRDTMVTPSIRGRRTKRDVVADVAAGITR